jgi:hypothetical protein
MRWRAIRVCAALTVAAATAAGRLWARAATTRPVAVATGVAVVELFTSQGCSSCPPADAALADLARAAERTGRPVYTLAFHVDYWDHLGWADPFDDPAYSSRQQAYGRALKLDQVYTPQAVVNGRTQFVGSDRAAEDRAVADALATPAVARVSVAVIGSARDGSRVDYTATGAGAEDSVNVAVVEQGLSTEVKHGENAGQRLDQPSTVRWFTTASARLNHGEVVVPPLPAIRAGRASVVVFVQQPAQGSITGAAAAPLP